MLFQGNIQQPTLPNVFAIVENRFAKKNIVIAIGEESNAGNPVNARAVTTGIHRKKSNEVSHQSRLNYNDDFSETYLGNCVSGLVISGLYC
jgi:hypothetical protein